MASPPEHPVLCFPSVIAKLLPTNTERIDDSYQVCYRPHPKFIHSIATVQLYRGFAHSNLGCDLLIHKTRCHVTSYSLLSGCQEVERETDA